MDGTKIVTGDFPDVFGVIFGYYKGMSGVDGIDVCKSQNLFILVYFGAGYITVYDFTENTIFHASPFG
jgi:hypothetical protein